MHIWSSFEMSNVVYNSLLAADSTISPSAASILVEALRVTADEHIDPLVTILSIEEGGARRRDSTITVSFFIDVERQDFVIENGVARPDASGKLQAMALRDEMMQAAKIAANIRFIADEFDGTAEFGSVTVATVSAQVRLKVDLYPNKIHPSDALSFLYFT
jgi:hypothetical protein